MVVLWWTVFLVHCLLLWKFLSEIIICNKSNANDHVLKYLCVTTSSFFAKKNNGITLFFSLSDNKLAKISPDPQVKHEAKPCKQNTLEYHLNFGSLHVECYFETWPVSQFYNVVVSIHVQWEICSHLSKWPMDV